MFYIDAVPLLTAATTNGDGPVGQNPRFNQFRTSAASVYVYGTWGGAAVSISASPDGGITWLPIPNASFTANGIYNIDVTATAIKATLSQASGTTSLTAIVL